MSISYKWLMFLVVSIIVIGIPRFDRHDLFGIDRYTTGGRPATIAKADSARYENHVLYFRGEVGAVMLDEPWVYRPLPAYVASFLPFSAMTSLNILNYLALIAGLVATLKMFHLMKLSSLTSLVGGILYTFSFPNFFYGTIGFIDPVLVGFLTVSLYLVVSGRSIPFIVLCLLGALVKETYIIMLPIWFMYQWLVEGRGLLRSAACALALTASFIGTMLAVRFLTPVASDYFWTPDSKTLIANLTSYRGWASFLLTLGPAGFIASYYLARRNLEILEEPLILVFTTGFIAGFAVFGYSIIGATADGRSFWIAYPFMLPLACLQVEEFMMRKDTLANNHGG